MEKKKNIIIIILGIIVLVLSVVVVLFVTNVISFNDSSDGVNDCNKVDNIDNQNISNNQDVDDNNQFNPILDKIDSVQNIIINNNNKYQFITNDHFDTSKIGVFFNDIELKNDGDVDEDFYGSHTNHPEFCEFYVKHNINSFYLNSFDIRIIDNQNVIEYGYADSHSNDNIKN